MKPAIHMQHVTKSFGSKTVLDDVNLRVDRGQVFGFLGPNGSGKTTTIRCLLDYIRPTAGEIKVFGNDVRDNAPEVKELVGYLPSDTHLHANWTALDHLEFVARLRRVTVPQNITDEFDLDLHTKVRHLSTGNKQKLSIALAFIGNPKLIVMDEPTRGLDPLLQNKLYDMIRQFSTAGGTVFFSSHNLSEVQLLCDGVAVIRGGKLAVSGQMKDILDMRLHNIVATTTTRFRKSDFAEACTDIRGLTPKTIHLRIKGDINPILHRLTKYKLTDLEVMPVDLEEVFMEYY